MQRTPAEKDKDFQKIYFTFSLISAKFSFFLYIFVPIYICVSDVSTV